MAPGFDDAKTTEMRARLDDRLGLWAVTYLLFFVKLGPGLALFLALVFAIWIGWRWLCRKCPAVAWAVWWHVKAEGALVFVKACEMGLERTVSKRAGSLYRSGTSRNWLKCRNPEFQRGMSRMAGNRSRLAGKASAPSWSGRLSFGASLPAGSSRKATQGAAGMPQNQPRALCRPFSSHPLLKGTGG